MDHRCFSPMHHTHHSPTTHHSPLATHHSPHAPLASPRTTRHAPLTTHHSPLAEKKESNITAEYTPGKPFAIDGDQRRRAVPIDSEDMVVRHAITEMSKHGEMWGRDARGPAGVIHMLHTCTHARPSTHTHNHDLTPHPRALPPGLLRKPNCKLGTWHRDFPHFGHVARKPATCFIVLEKGNGVCCAHTLTSPHPIPPNLTTSPPPPTPTPTSTPHPPPHNTSTRPIPTTPHPAPPLALPSPQLDFHVELPCGRTYIVTLSSRDLQVGDIIIFDGDVWHRGHAYATSCVAVHIYLDVPAVQRVEPNEAGSFQKGLGQ